MGNGSRSKSGTARSSRPRGTAEQRRYYSTARTPSGTPRTGEISPQLRAGIKADIEKAPEKYDLSQYAHLYPQGYPYAIEGKAVSKTDFEQYVTAKTEEARLDAIRKARQADAYRAGRPSAPREVYLREEKLAEQKRIFQERIDQAKLRQQQEAQRETIKEEAKRTFRTPEFAGTIERVARKIIYKKDEPPSFFGELGVGAVTTIPYALASVGRLQEEQIKSIKETGTMGFGTRKALKKEWEEIKQIPTAFREEPVLTTGRVLGSLATWYVTGAGIKAYKQYKQPKLKVQASKKIITEYDPIKKGVKYYREQALVKVYEQVKNKWKLKETLTPEAFYETYGIKQIGIEPIIKGKAGVKFYTKTGQAIRGTFPKDILGIVEKTALGKKPTVAVGGIIIKREGRIYTGDILGVSKRLGRRQTFGLADISMGKERITGIGVSRRLIKLTKDKQILELGREVGISKGLRERSLFFGEYVFKPLVERPRPPVTFMKPSPLALERISKLKYTVPLKAIEKVVEKIVTPKVKYPKGVLFGATAGIIKPVTATTFFQTEEEVIEAGLSPFPVEKAPLSPFEKPKQIFIPEVEEGVYVPREEFMMGFGESSVERIKSQLKTTAKTIQKEKEKLKQIPEQAIIQIQVAKQRLASLQQQKILQAQAQKQALKQLQQLKQAQAQITTPMITPTISPAVPFPFISAKPEVLKRALEKVKKKVSGFDLFVRSKGVDIFMGTYPKAKGLKIGAKIVRETLSAQFKLLPSKKMVKPSLEYFEPSPEIFREFKIRKGVAIKTPLQYIQRRGKRLGTRKEVTAIQRARKKKKGLLEWW